MGGFEKLVLQGQRPVAIPAWGNAPGTGATRARAESPHHPLARKSADMDRALSPPSFSIENLGRCPRLGWCRAFGPPDSVLVADDGWRGEFLDPILITPHSLFPKKKLQRRAEAGAPGGEGVVGAFGAHDFEVAAFH